MECGLCGGKAEDQPSVTSIDRRKSQNVAEKGAIGFRILAVDDHMSARNHDGLRYRSISKRILARVRREVHPLNSRIRSGKPDPPRRKSESAESGLTRGLGAALPLSATVEPVAHGGQPRRIGVEQGGKRKQRRTER